MRLRLCVGLNLDRDALFTCFVGLSPSFFLFCFCFFRVSCYSTGKPRRHHPDLRRRQRRPVQCRPVHVSLPVLTGVFSEPSAAQVVSRAAFLLFFFFPSPYSILFLQRDESFPLVIGTLAIYKFANRVATICN